MPNKHNITSSTLLQSSNLVGTRNAKIACCIPQFLNDHVVSTPHWVKVSAITGFSGGNLQIAKKNITVLSNTIYVCSNRRCKIDIPIKLQKIMKYDSVNGSWKQKEDNAKQVQKKTMTDADCVLFWHYSVWQFCLSLVGHLHTAAMALTETLPWLSNGYHGRLA